MTGIDEFMHYDDLLLQPLKELGWLAEFIPWDQANVPWHKYDAVIIRSTWDYQANSEKFIYVLTEIENSGATLINPLEIVKWNINKVYLKELESNGVEIVPTVWLEQFDFQAIDSYFKLFNSDQIIIKPTISAGADNTFWLKKESYHSLQAILEKSLADKQLMLQPFIPAVIDEGEFSLFYFNDSFSHCILKTPKKGDFRVQEEFGSCIKSIDPGSELLAAAVNTLKSLPSKVLYARIDLVKYQNSYKVMEVELIEPSLYFNFDDQSPTRFAQALNNWLP